MAPPFKPFSWGWPPPQIPPVPAPYLVKNERSLIALKNLRESSAISGKKDLAVCFIVLRSSGRKRCLNMCHGNSENSYGCSYLLRICFIYWANVSVSRSWVLLQGCWPRTRCLLIYQQTSANQNAVHLKNGFIWKCSREWLLWTGYASWGSLRKKPQSPTVKNIASLFKEFCQCFVTLRTESPSIFLDKSGRGRNLCRHPQQFILSMLQIQIFLRRQSNRYRSIHCVCQQM